MFYFVILALSANPFAWVTGCCSKVRFDWWFLFYRVWTLNSLRVDAVPGSLLCLLWNWDNWYSSLFKLGYWWVLASSSPLLRDLLATSIEFEPAWWTKGNCISLWFILLSISGSSLLVLSLWGKFSGRLSRALCVFGIVAWSNRAVGLSSCMFLESD